VSSLLRGLTACGIVGAASALLGAVGVLAGEARFESLKADIPKLDRMLVRVIEVQMVSPTREVVCATEETFTTNGNAVQRHVRRRTWPYGEGSSLRMPDPVPETWPNKVEGFLQEKGRVSIQYWDGLRHTTFTPGAGDPPVWRGVRLARPLRPYFARSFLEGSYHMFGTPIPGVVDRMDSVPVQTRWGQRVLVLTIRNPRSKPSSNILILDSNHRDMPCGLFLSGLPGASAIEVVKSAESLDDLRSGLDANISYEVEAWLSADGLLFPKRVRQSTFNHQFKRDGPSVRLDRIWFVREIALHEEEAWGALPPILRGTEAEVRDELLQTRVRYHADGSQERLEQQRVAPHTPRAPYGPPRNTPSSGWRVVCGALAGILLAIALLLGLRAWAVYRRSGWSTPPVSTGT